MSENLIYIKNMVCPRCIEAVREVLVSLDLKASDVKLGKVRLTKPLTDALENALEASLKNRGFLLLKDKEAQLAESVKTVIIDLVHYTSELPMIKNSEYIASKLNINYATLSKVFSQTEGITIERYLILQKIEKVKELLSYDELTLSEIAFKLGYKSVQHLSSQFKQITGMSVSAYKKDNNQQRKSLDKL